MTDQIKNTAAGKTIALTGGTGFLGGHVIDCLLDAGHHIQALTRRSQPERDGITWIEGSMSDTESLEKLCSGADTLIHVAGLTKALTRDIFFDVNVKGSKLVFEAAAKTGIDHVIHISSLAAREPRLSHYGASKAGTEMLLTARKWPFSWTIVRPPAIYGPGDKEILKLLKSTKLGVLPAPGSSKNRVSMIHARDLAEAITEMCDKSQSASIVEIDDGKTGGYQISEIADAVPSTSDRKTKIIPLPFWILGSIGAVNGLFAHLIKKPAMLTLSTAKYLCHPDWVVREGRRPKLAKWSPKFGLKAGLEDTIDWYRKNGLL